MTKARFPGNLETPERVPLALDVVKRTEPRQSERERERSSTSGAARKRSKKRRIARRDGLRCNYCFVRFKRLSEATIDHFIPVSKGGTSNISNLVLACNDCNQRKADEISIK